MSAGYLLQFSCTFIIATKNDFSGSREENRLENVDSENTAGVVAVGISVRQENINRENKQLSCYKRDSSQYGLLLVFLSKELKITWCLAF